MTENPVFRKELLTRFRLRTGSGLRRSAVMTGALLLVLHWLFLRALMDRPPTVSPDHYRDTWTWIVALQYLAICLMTPGIAANAFTQEREQQTWDMLVITRLTSAEIVLGKWLARLLPSLALLAICFPLTALSAALSFDFRLDRSIALSLESPDFRVVRTVVTLREFAGTYLVMLATAVFYTTFGLYLSHRAHRTSYALIGAYTVVIGGFFLSTTLLFLAVWSFSNRSVPEHFLLYWVNPLYLFSHAISPEDLEDTLYVLAGAGAYLAASAALLWHIILRLRNATRPGITPHARTSG
ncbi:MAG: ABC transporter permease subunit [Chloroherpetonaceae bacterium]|nr:ABC transporter permease subunit [Chthonomonadaceae bacterium]MDW8208127.1 ABC transporter permease subunit [Chloroherpetonaceae bacterium]